MTTKGIKRPKPFTLRHPLKLSGKMKVLPLDKDGKVIGYAHDENGGAYPVVEKKKDK
jgi:hypothetical protein